MNTSIQNTPKSSSLEGVIKTNRKKTGYIDMPDDAPSIFFPEGNLGTALAGDTVVYHLTGQTDFRSKLPIGKVDSIVERSKERLVGTIVKENGATFLAPDDKRIYTNIILPNNKDAEENMKALVSFTWKAGSQFPEGEVLEIIGKAGENNAEMKSIVMDKGFDTSFPPAVEREAEHLRDTKRTISEAEWKFRRDMRDTLTMTVDPIDAKDFDDALSLKELPNGNYEIGVHIADVAYFVTPGSELDAEAQKRQFSVYLVDRTIPMLPEALSNDLCSLNPGEDKRAFSAVFEMNKEGKVLSRWFGRTAIHSDKRFAYEDAQDAITDSGNEFHKEFTILNSIAYKLREEKVRNGAIDFESDEVKFVLDDEGVPLKVIKKQRFDAHKLIEEFMLLANREVALVVSKDKAGKDSPSIYRSHDAPDADRIDELSIFLKALGHDLEKKKGVVTNKSIQKLINDIDGTPQEALIKTAVLRSMAKATYDIKNIGHFGLGFDFYTHFTSPIRRYPDLLIHRILWKHLNNEPITGKDVEFFKATARKASEKEKNAAQAERESIKYKQVEYMQNHIGETFDATVSGVSDFGIFVEEVNTKSEGLVRLSNLGGDFFSLDKKTYCVIGRRTGKKYSLGDPIRVKLIGADTENNNLDFELAK